MQNAAFSFEGSTLAKDNGDGPATHIFCTLVVRALMQDLVDLDYRLTSALQDSNSRLSCCWELPKPPEYKVVRASGAT